MAHRHPADWGSGDWHRLTVNVPFQWCSVDFCLCSLCVCGGGESFCCSSSYSCFLNVVVALVFVFISAVLIFFSSCPRLSLSFPSLVSPSLSHVSLSLPCSLSVLLGFLSSEFVVDLVLKCIHISLCWNAICASVRYHFLHESGS